MMRPAGSTGIYVAVIVLGGFVFLLGAILAVAAVAVGQDAWREKGIIGAVNLVGLGAIVAGWSIKQMRLAIPLGASAAPLRLWPWIIGLLVGLFCVLAIGGGLFFLLYYLQEMM
jgi:hypothetical protein